MGKKHQTVDHDPSEGTRPQPRLHAFGNFPEQLRRTKGGDEADRALGERDLYPAGYPVLPVHVKPPSDENDRSQRSYQCGFGDVPAFGFS
tara:strand:+ start:5037 stop:5306 length:270 start_codon:yes stop_codon:yes gene_type:complete